MKRQAARVRHGSNLAVRPVAKEQASHKKAVAFPGVLALKHRP